MSRWIARHALVDPATRQAYAAGDEVPESFTGFTEVVATGGVMRIHEGSEVVVVEDADAVVANEAMVFTEEEVAAPLDPVEAVVDEDAVLEEDEVPWRRRRRGR